MELAALFLVLFSVSVLIEDTQANKYGLSKRFFFDELVGALSKEECILCKCYKQCHARDFNLNEGDVCADYEDSIDCSEIDRCTCCNELFIYQACLNGGSCHNIGNGDFTCKCPQGTYGKRCEHGVPQVQQTDLCASAPCQNGGHCINGKSGYTCQCAGAWTGHNCETDLNIGTQSNHCASNPCQNGAVCNEGTNTYTCQCLNGWTGKNCDTHVDLCSSCQNGKCVHNNGVYSCSCEKGWKGNYCQTDVNECDLDACKHGSACTNTPGNFTCSCTSGWSGNQCDLDIDECLSQPCKNGSTCQNTDGFFRCACANGWTGFDCGTDIDECSMFHICHNGATCKNTLGHFTCTCLSGWTGTQCHNDIDECTSNPCLHGSTCINTPGSYSCNCLAGWSGDMCQNAPQPADCDHVCTLRSVVRLSSIENVNAATCSSTGLHSSNEALPMQCCNLPNSASWRKGEKVMTLCNAGTPYLYATVAAFTNGVLEPDTAGVITGCLPQTEPGFMMIRQSCSSNPHVYHVNGTNINQLDNDPDNYYFVV